MNNKRIVDLSKHNGNVDMLKLKNNGVYGIIQRVGYGKNNIDKTAKQNIDNALKVGLKVGCYWFLYSLNEEQALQESKHFNTFLQRYRGKLELPIYCDFEYDTERYAKQKGVYFTKESRTRIVITFLHYLETQGWYVGNYANIDYIYNGFNNLDNFDLWLAFWDINPPKHLFEKSGLWQFTSTGRIQGVTGDVDINYLLKDYPTIIKQNNFNGYVDNYVDNVDNTDYITIFAKEVIKGKYGNGKDRIENIYTTIQNEVNNIIYKKSLQNNYITEIAKEVIKGKYGNGEDRKNKLYKVVQEKVNKII